EAFEIIGNDTGILIEIKECKIEKIATFIAKYNRKNKVFIGSFNIEYVIQARKLIPEIPAALITGSIPDNVTELVCLGVRKLDIQFNNLNAENVKRFMSSGFLVNAWTPDEKKHLISCTETGVQFITTNRPDRLIAILHGEQ
ncbi:MAG: glycerophosphodiester phosphodiesterase, partial [Candidatus Omnitrophica bacterium]|nr:glycerophosphodiester phosphodiesterase [Candidatus Omnitrophota bacterium]